MKNIWKKYGLWIQAIVLATAIAIMIYYKFWEEVPEKRWLRWAQFIIFLVYFISRIVKLIARGRVTNTVEDRE